MCHAGKDGRSYKPEGTELTLSPIKHHPFVSSPLKN
jgi:hypothetical protein